MCVRARAHVGMGKQGEVEFPPCKFSQLMWPKLEKLVERKKDKLY